MAGNFDGGYVAQMRQLAKNLADGAYFVTAKSREYSDPRYDGKDTRVIIVHVPPTA